MVELEFSSFWLNYTNQKYPFVVQVCLDKRDASGRIETYQEPFLYRCSLTVHAAWIYDTMNSKIPRISR